MRRILVTGAAGQLGHWIVRTFAGDTVVALTRASLDLTNSPDVEAAVASAAPDVVVNCAAFNDVDGAETRPLDALRVNAFAVRDLARAAARAGAVFVHYSTDFVFDGTADRPYDEQARPAPRSTYGASKLLGEWFALETPRAFVLRVESLFGLPPAWTGRRGSLDLIADRLRAGEEVTVFTDRIVSPSYMPDVAAATRHLVDTGAAPGLYHCVSAGQASWHDIALETAARLGVQARLRPIAMDEVTLAAARPRFCALDPGKLAAAGFPMPTWQDALDRWIGGLQT